MVMIESELEESSGCKIQPNVREAQMLVPTPPHPMPQCIHFAKEEKIGQEKAFPRGLLATPGLMAGACGGTRSAWIMATLRGGKRLPLAGEQVVSLLQASSLPILPGRGDKCDLGALSLPFWRWGWE